MNTLKGTIKRIGETKIVGSNNEKLLFVVETEEQYPQIVEIELFKHGVQLIAGFNVGDHITVDYNLRGREWINPEGEPKVFNTIQGWKLHHSNQDSDPIETAIPVEQP